MCIIILIHDGPGAKTPGPPWNKFCGIKGDLYDIGGSLVSPKAGLMFT